jgi:hypothetical protein
MTAMILVSVKTQLEHALHPTKPMEHPAMTPTFALKRMYALQAIAMAQIQSLALVVTNVMMSEPAI